MTPQVWTEGVLEASCKHLLVTCSAPPPPRRSDIHKAIGLVADRVCLYDCSPTQVMGMCGYLPSLPRGHVRRSFYLLRRQPH